ncbi:AAA family ATPase [Nocardioides immobilis]|uniref:AAA family ATPase n=1 Tax=Nocardioides immobilis TaxID=2049295 RepID=A0A417XYG2_9ACTN|nr:AAA family ATPase [Nocardioides immobilis]RHW25408.1 AAA family ATPase [Nocardioides immobilis]
MAIRNRTDYEHALQVVGICVSARIPVLLWGNPGEGKTAVIESAAGQGWHVESLIISHYEPSDFAGLPVVTPDGSVDLAPPSWAKRLAAVDGPAIAFFDEFSTASPSLQAAALRPLTHYEVGSLKLPDTVSFVAAANPADVATAGWELAAPTASRFVHVEWSLPLEVYAEGLVTGAWPTLPVYEPPVDLGTRTDAELVLVSGFLRARESQLSAIPSDAAARGRAFPTPRTWDHAARLSAYAQAVSAPKDVRRLLITGCIGEAVAHEFLSWVSSLDLPDPEDLLADVAGAAFAGMRPDRVYVTLQGVLAAVARNSSVERWTDAVRLAAKAGETVGLDPAVPAVRALLRDGLRPGGAAVPPEIKVFAPALALAGLLPGA